MKKLFFLVSLPIIIFFGCKKNYTTNNNTIVKPNPLVADAGLDTVLNMPLPGTGFIFKAILNGKTSHDLSGKIVSYWWTDISQQGESTIMTQDSDSTEVRLFLFPNPQAPGKSIRKFSLEVWD